MPIDYRIHRCEHIRVSGARCGSPALRGQPCCYYHNKARESATAFSIPLLEDATSIQMGLQAVINALCENRIDAKTAGVLVYALQVAFKNHKSGWIGSSDDSVTELAGLDDVVHMIAARPAPDPAAKKSPQPAAPDSPPPLSSHPEQSALG